MSEPTAMQLFAAELIRELKPMLSELAIGPNPNELLTPYQVARELKVAPKQVKRLIAERTLRTVEDMKQLVSRRELQRYTAGEPKRKEAK